MYKNRLAVLRNSDSNKKGEAKRKKNETFQMKKKTKRREYKYQIIQSNPKKKTIAAPSSIENVIQINVAAAAVVPIDLFMIKCLMVPPPPSPRVLLSRL